MQLTTKGRFAVTAMIDLAMRDGEGPITLAAISERQKISLSYLEQLFGKLRRHGLVESVRGPGGGYCMAKRTDEVAIVEIIQAVDEPMDATQCGGRENCRDEERCMTHELWSNLNARIFEYLSSVRLSQLVERQRSKNAAVMEDKRKDREVEADKVIAV
jgi:Rrf2 family iron-sulfur cluster assembly transcriptional regulator